MIYKHYINCGHNLTAFVCAYGWFSVSCVLSAWSLVPILTENNLQIVFCYHFNSMIIYELFHDLCIMCQCQIEISFMNRIQCINDISK